MKGKDTGMIDQSEVISTKKLQAIVKQHSKHEVVVLYDDVSDKELQEKERTISRRVRNANDKRVWDVITGDREWAWKVIMTSCAMLSNGIGFGISNMMRSAKGHDSDVTRGAVFLATFSQWRELALQRKLNPDMCIDVLWGGMGFLAAERKHHRARHAARKNLADCLDLLVDMRDELPPAARLKAWRDAGLARAADDGIAVTDETLGMCEVRK